MTHPADGVLRAYVDGELPAAGRSAVERHTAACEACRGRIEAVREDAAWADRMLRAPARATGAAATGAAASGVWADLSSVWRGGRADAGTRAAAAIPGRTEPPGQPESRRRTGRPPLATAAAGLAAVLVLGALALPPVRAAAAGLLSVFRARRLQVVTVSPGDLAQVRRLLASGAGGVRVAGLATIRVSPTHVRPVPATPSQAAALVGFGLTPPDPAPAGYRLQSVRVRPAQRFAFRLHAAAVDRLLASLGSARSLPASLHGATIRLDVPASATLVYDAAGAGTPLRIRESRSPSLLVPKGVDAAQVRAFLLSLPFVPADLRSQIAAVADWRQTALVPVQAGRALRVTVGGAQGVFVRPAAPAAAGGYGGTAAGSTLVWISGGVIRAVSGAPTLAAAQAVAAAMR